MSNVFCAGRELVYWDLAALGPAGPYRLSMRHSSGTIVEYFTSTRQALARERELEDLLIAARGGPALDGARRQA
jgi:hypothetical protein